MKTLAETAFFSSPVLGKKELTKSEWKLRDRLRTNERALRETLKEMRDDKKAIDDYIEERRGLTWVRYIITPSGEFTPGLHKPLITINLRSEERGMIVEGNSRLINVVFDRYLDMNEWRKLLVEQLEIRLRGWKSEEQVFKATQKLVSEADNPIISVIPASPHLDKERGIDFFFICNGRSGVEKVPLQCKTGAFGQIVHRVREPRIPSIVIHPGMWDDDIRTKLLDIIKKYLGGEIIHV